MSRCSEQSALAGAPGVAAEGSLAEAAARSWDEGDLARRPMTRETPAASASATMGDFGNLDSVRVTGACYGGAPASLGGTVQVGGGPASLAWAVSGAVRDGAAPPQSQAP
jgi:hypothetical protein